LNVVVFLFFLFFPFSRANGWAICQDHELPSQLNGVSERNEGGNTDSAGNRVDGSSNVQEPDTTTEANGGATHKLDELVRERDFLRAEVTEMRKSLEEMQLKHQEEHESLQSTLKESETKKEHAENQFQKLLERVNTIKSQLGERLKEDAVCFSFYYDTSGWYEFC
jgi:chromosome segregation ATPase